MLVPAAGWRLWYFGAGGVGRKMGPAGGGALRCAASDLLFVGEAWLLACCASAACSPCADCASCWALPAAPPCTSVDEALLLLLSRSTKALGALEARGGLG